MEDHDYDRFTSHDGISIAYRVSGSGSRVILVHGYTASSDTNFACHYQRRDSGLVETEGPTLESALVTACCQLAMLDLRGHGRSDSPHLPERYSMKALADDVRALIDHLGWDRAAVAGYSLGAWIAERLLSDSWVSRAALCGISSDQITGKDPEFDTNWRIASRCFLDGCWTDYPDYQVFREWAERSSSDFGALGYVALALEAISVEELRSANVPVLVLNGGADLGAEDEHDLTPFIPGAKRITAGHSDHETAPSDPVFQAELSEFLTDSSG